MARIIRKRSVETYKRREFLVKKSSEEYRSRLCHPPLAQLFTA